MQMAWFGIFRGWRSLFSPFAWKKPLATIRRSDNGCRYTSCRHCIISDDEIYCC